MEEASKSCTDIVVVHEVDDIDDVEDDTCMEITTSRLTGADTESYTAGVQQILGDFRR